MKYMKQLGIILLISFLGEVLKYVLPLPIPASIYGLVCMLVALKTNLIALRTVREVGGFLIEIMPMMFIPAAVGLLDAWGVLAPIFGQIAVITVVSTIVVMVVSGRVTQFVLRRHKVREDTEQQKIHMQREMSA